MIIYGNQLSDSVIQVLFPIAIVGGILGLIYLSIGVLASWKHFCDGDSGGHKRYILIPVD